jgi:F-type H+-transporting ATPase subunit gamma
MYTSKLQRMCRGGLLQSQFLQNQSQLLVPVSQRDFAVSEKVLALRIKAVRNIGKITKAMKMVAASKMRGDLERLANGKQFGFNGVDMMMKCDPYMQRRAPDMPSDPRELLVPLTSDRGLCGSINSGIFRNVRDYIATKDRTKLKIFSIGDKGAVAMRRPFPDLIKVGLSDISTPYNYPMVMAVSEHLNAHAQNSDKILIFYNEFKSAIASVIKVMELIPRHRFMETVKFGKLYFKAAIPDKNTANPALYELYLTSNLWICFLNNSAAEQSSRMNAMENASKNAGEIVDKLTLQYNYARQARITTELCEIISGASAM